MSFLFVVVIVLLTATNALRCIGAAFLLHNGYFCAAKTFMSQIEAVVYHVAASNIDKELLQRIMQCIVDNTDYDEELKIDIANAISNCELIKD